MPNTIEDIGSDVFLLSKNLKEINIPKSIKNIEPTTFCYDTLLNFEDLMKIKAKDFYKMKTIISSNIFERYWDVGNTKLISLKNGTYYVSLNDCDYMIITKNEIKSISPTSYLISDNPEKFVNHIYNLLSIQVYESDALSIMNDDKFNTVFKVFKEFINDINKINKDKNNEEIKNILKSYGIYNNLLLNGILINILDKDTTILVANNITKSLENYVKFSKYFNVSDKDEYNNEYMYKSLHQNIKNIVSYCNILEKYKVYDKFLYNYNALFKLPPNIQELLIKNYNNNLKRLLKESYALHDINNLIDLIKFCSIMGVFSDNKILSQKSTTFIIEKILSIKKSNGENNEFRIICDDIHRFFSDLNPREELDLDFVLFFIENYKELIKTEKEKSGFISNIYNYFKEISNCSTSNRGYQRQIKVTVDKCKMFLFMNKFKNIKEGYEDLACLLGRYFNSDDILDKAIEIVDESKNAPRNIFTKVNYDENGCAIYDNSKGNDLKDKLDSGLSYEWLPKQDYENLILGKYCNCCSHIEGAGAGIMRASMILDCCQNLVIRDECDNIIAKATIWVNKDEQYGIFNTFEINIKKREEDEINNKVYDAFIKGTEEFVRSYNKNNKEKPILNISIGTKCNTLIDEFLNKHKTIKPFKPIDYSSYSYMIGRKTYGNYKGDHHDEQILILSKKA